MKTFDDIHRAMFNEIYKSPEGWPPDLSQAKLAELAAKEYAKQWVKKALEETHETYVTATVEEYEKKIDDQ